MTEHSGVLYEFKFTVFLVFFSTTHLNISFDFLALIPSELARFERFHAQGGWGYFHRCASAETQWGNCRIWQQRVSRTRPRWARRFWNSRNENKVCNQRDLPFRTNLSSTTFFLSHVYHTFSSYYLSFQIPMKHVVGIWAEGIYNPEKLAFFHAVANWWQLGSFWCLGQGFIFDEFFIDLGK